MEFFMILRKKTPLFIFFALLFFFFAGQVKASRVDSPTIIELGNKKSEEFLNQLFVKGLTPANTEVLVYIDGVYTDFAKVKSEGTASDSFYYEHPTALAGGNEVKLIAQDKTSLVLSPPVEAEYVIPDLPAPTLIAPEEEDAIGSPKPFITGLSVNRSFVHIYIDGVYNGRTEILTHKSGTANFAYKPFLNLGVGPHKVWVVAEDEGGRKSGLSNILPFKIEEPMPAPTLFYPVVNSHTNYSRPFVVGLAKNYSFIKVFIDHKLAGQFSVANHQSGTANFAYKPFLALARGSHLVYTTAADKRGKESQWSNIIYFSVRQPIIAQSAQEEKEGLVGKIEEPAAGDKKEPPLVISPSGDVEKGGEEKAVSDEEIKGIIGEVSEREKTAPGLIDETKKEQGKLGLNLIIFIVFLLGIIGWIFWVNRELVKEQRANKESPENPPLSEEKDNSSSNSGENKLL